jgi:hypothetical protein
MTNVAETFDSVHAMLDKWPVGGEEHMVVSLGDVVRIESPFTDDPDEIRWTLERMRNDPDLYAGNYGRLTERRFFDRVEVLFDLLERFDGRKTLVMFSGPFINDGFFHDPSFKWLSGLATATRSAIYPVDTGGLRTPIDANAPVSTLAGPPMLRRLANETGGRMTTGTNEIGLAYAKAHRDLGCNYTAGFYDNRTVRDKKRRLTLRLIDRPELRIVYPEFYVVRSPEEKRKSLFRTATITPQMFESETMQVNLFVLEPRSPSRWQSLLAVEFRAGGEAFIDEGERWELKAQVRRTNGTIVRSFKEKVRMPATDPATGATAAVTLYRGMRLRPGRYIVSAVLSDPQADTPVAATRPAVIAKVPKGEPFMVGPILGHTATADHTFEPLLGGEAERGEVLDALTVVCLVGSEAAVDVREIGRQVTRWGGAGALQFDAVSARLGEEGGVSCERVLDRLPTEGLEPGRYELNAVAETASQVTGRGTAEFTVLEPSE